MVLKRIYSGKMHILKNYEDFNNQNLHKGIKKQNKLSPKLAEGRK